MPRPGIGRLRLDTFLLAYVILYYGALLLAMRRLEGFGIVRACTRNLAAVAIVHAATDLVPSLPGLLELWRRL